MIPIKPENTSNMPDNSETLNASAFCKDFIRGSCTRENCRFIHEMPPPGYLKELFRFCHDYQNKGCFRANCKFIHSTKEAEDHFYATGTLPQPPEVMNQESVPPSLNIPPQQLLQHLLYKLRGEDSPPEAKIRRLSPENCELENQVLTNTSFCPNCETLEHKVKLLHENLNILLKKVADLNEKNIQLTSMNEILLVQTASVRDQPCVITSRHGTSAPVSLATVSVTPIVSLAGALPGLVPTAANPNLTLAPAASRAQLLTPAPQILTVSTTQQLVGNSGALIVTSAGAQQLMQVSDSGTIMGGGQTMVAVPALTLAPSTQQLIGNPSQTTVQQLVQSQLAPQHQAQQFAAQQSVQHLAQQSAQHLAAQQSAQHLAQQSAQHLAAQQSAQHLAQQSAQLAAQHNAQHMAQQSAHLAQQSAQHAQHLAAAAAHQSAQHLAAQQSAQHLAAQQSAQQQLVPSAQQLVHQTSTQQITISSTSQPMALSNSQAQPMSFPMISQSILPH